MADYQLDYQMVDLEANILHGSVEGVWSPEAEGHPMVQEANSFAGEPRRHHLTVLSRLKVKEADFNEVEHLRVAAAEEADKADVHADEMTTKKMTLNLPTKLKSKRK